jgi:hypothetical protein
MLIACVSETTPVSAEKLAEEYQYEITKNKQNFIAKEVGNAVNFR